MPIFYNKKYDYFIITNYKVMYSTLLHQECLDLVVLEARGAYREFTARQQHTKTIVLTRNPYTKLISLFEDKFVRFPAQPLSERVKYGDNDGWQVCHKIFFPYLNISKDSSAEIISTKLKNISFADFVSILPKVYYKEIHFHPQTVILQQCQIKQATIIKMEQIDCDYIQKELGLDLSLKLNQNPKDSSSWLDYFTSAEILEIVNNLYQEDFKYLNYDQYQSVKQFYSFPNSSKSLPNWLFGI